MLTVTAVDPVWMETIGAFVMRQGVCGFERVTRPAYPPSPEGERLRELRLALKLSLRQAAARMGLAPADLSAVERGSSRLGNWGEAERLLRHPGRGPLWTRGPR